MSDDKTLQVPLYRLFYDFTAEIKRVLEIKFEHEYDYDYLLRASVKYMIYGTATPRDLKSGTLSNRRFLTQEEELEINNHLLVTYGLSPREYTRKALCGFLYSFPEDKIMRSIVLFGKCAKYVTAADINMLKSVIISTSPNTYYNFNNNSKEELEEDKESYDVEDINVYKLIRMPHISICSSSIDIENNQSEYEARRNLAFVKYYSKLYTEVLRKFSMPIRAAIARLGKAPGAVEQLKNNPFITAEEFMQMALGNKIVRVCIMEPKWLGSSIKDGMIYLDDKLQINISLIDWINSVGELSKCFDILKTYFLDPAIMGEEYVNRVRRYKPDIDNISLMDSNVLITEVPYCESDEIGLWNLNSDRDKQLPIIMFICEYHRTLLEIEKVYKQLQDKYISKYGFKKVQREVSEALLRRAKYIVYYNKYNQGDIVTSSLLPLNMLFEDTQSIAYHAIVDDIILAPETVNVNYLRMQDIDVFSFRLINMFTSDSTKSQLSKVDWYPTNKKTVAELINEDIDIGELITKRYLFRADIIYYIGQQGITISGKLMFDIDKLYTLKLKDTLTPQGVQFDLDLSDITVDSKLNQPNSQIVEGSYILKNVMKNKNTGKNTVLFAVPLEEKQISDSSTGQKAYVPIKEIRSALRGLCSSAFSTVFMTKAQSVYQYEFYSYIDSRNIGDGHSINLVTKEREKE